MLSLQKLAKCANNSELQPFDYAQGKPPILLCQGFEGQVNAILLMVNPWQTNGICKIGKNPRSFPVPGILCDLLFEFACQWTAAHAVASLFRAKDLFIQEFFAVITESFAFCLNREDGAWCNNDDQFLMGSSPALFAEKHIYDGDIAEQRGLFLELCFE
jgi:hypothetical protein